MNIRPAVFGLPADNLVHFQGIDPSCGHALRLLDETAAEAVVSAAQGTSSTYHLPSSRTCRRITMAEEENGHGMEHGV